jgi:hypothetical protein
MVPAPLLGMFVFAIRTLAPKRRRAINFQRPPRQRDNVSVRFLEAFRVLFWGVQSQDVFVFVSGPSVVTFCGIFLREIGSNETRSNLAAREIASCLQENVQRRLHKTPQGVCRLGTGSIKVDSIRLTYDVACGCRLKGRFGCLLCGSYVRHLTMNGN